MTLHQPPWPAPCSKAVSLFVTAACLAGGLLLPQRAPCAEPAAATHGETLFRLHCATCHQADGHGHVGIAPSLRNRDFLAIASDDFIRQTVRDGRPGTAMVARPDLVEQDVSAIIAYLRSLPVANPISVSVDPTLKFAGDREAGAEKFTLYCASCHGPFGEGYMANVPGTGIGLPGFLAAAPDDYILQTLKQGRIGTPMQPFLGPRGLANLNEQDAYDIIAHLRYLGDTYAERLASLPLRPGDAKVGEVHFRINCVACHQEGGTGKIGLAPSIRNRDFLAIASDDFIRQTVMNGRPGTGMMGRPDLPPQTIIDIITYLRALPVVNAVEIRVDPDKTFPGRADLGAEPFALYCASCHGPHGEGYAIGVPGPGIGLTGFLNVASDDYIYQTVKHGRLGTPMKSFLGANGLANLSDTQVHDIIAYLRTLPDQQPAAAESGASDFE